MTAAPRDVEEFVSALGIHAAKLKTMAGEAKRLDDYYNKLDINTAITNNPEWVKAPLTDADIMNYVIMLRAMADFLDNVRVTASDRRQVMERVGSSPLGT